MFSRARKSRPSGKTPILNLISFVFPIVAFAIYLVVLVAGLYPGFTQLYYFRVTTDDLSLDSKLSASEILKDIAQVSGTDLTGQTATASSLDLGRSYTVHLSTSCQTSYDDKTTCSPYQFGYSFDPRSALKLDDTVLEGKYDKELVWTLDYYVKFSPFISAAHYISIVFCCVNFVAACCMTRFAKLGLFVVLTSWLGSLFGLAASVGETILSLQFVARFNANFNKIGLDSSAGALYIASLVGALLCAVASITTTLKYLRVVRGLRASYPRGGPGLTSGIVTGEGYEKDGPTRSGNVASPGMKPLTLLQRIPTWGRHKYVQVEKQAAVVHPGGAAAVAGADPEHHGGDRAKGKMRAEEQAVLMMDPIGERDDDDAHDAEGPKAIAMRKLSPRPASSDDGADVADRAAVMRNVAEDSAYDPYSGRTRPVDGY